MANNFRGLQNFIESKYPDFRGNVEGGVYPPPWYALWISSLASYLWIIGIAIMLAGQQIFDAIGIRMPAIIVEMNKNKPAVFMTLFVINSLGNSLTATGAFEVYLNGNLIFSKLQMHRFPTGPEIAGAIEALGYKAVR